MGSKMSEIKKFPQRKPYQHDISTQEELDFLCNWLQVLFQVNPDLRGEINGYSIALTGKFIGLDLSNTISVCKVEGS